MANEGSSSKTDNPVLPVGEEVSYSHESHGGRTFFTKENQAQLFEILRCAVCLEIPKGGDNLQVNTCEKGHHFCMSCHKKLNCCAICRGLLNSGRNFVVEELITKLGPALGVTKPPLPAPESTSIKVGMGRYPCPHFCRMEIPGIGMLPHIRKLHPELLADNLRVNPFNLRLDWRMQISYQKSGDSSFSLQISDIGLLTIRVRFIEGGLRAWVQTLIREHSMPELSYKITLRHSNSDFGLNSAPVLGYFAPDSEQAFNVPAALLPTEGTVMKLFVSIWHTASESKTEFEENVLVPEDIFQFESDRRTRRNRKRNERRRRNNQKRMKERNGEASTSTSQKPKNQQ